MDSQQWVSEKTVRGITGLGLQTLRNQRHNGIGIPYSKIGKSVRYRVSDVIQFMEDRKVVPQE